MPSAHPEFTVSSLTSALKRTIESGFSKVVVEGEVSAVTAALEAGAAAAAEVGNVKCCEVIARPHPDVMKFLTTG